MRARFQVLVVLLALSGCANPALQPSADSVQLPPFFYGALIDNDTGAINQAAYAFGSPERTRGDPVEALVGIISVEYLASELDAPRWAEMSPLTKMQMVQARGEIRQTLGIAPGAPAQMVINALLRVLRDGQAGNMADARQVLAAPLFFRPADQTLRLLENLPPLPTAHAAALAAEIGTLPRPDFPRP